MDTLPLTADASWLAPQPPAAASALPAACFVSERHAALDRKAVFARAWQLVAHAAQCAEPGDHVVTALAGVPLLVVRGDDGVLRALHNVCRHRAGPLATCDGRGARALTCQYHGWQYALDGTLRGAPEMGRATGLDVTRIRLPQAAVREWQGLVFAALEPAMRFEDLVAGIDAAVAPHALVQLTFAQRAVYTLECDWKVYVDNYLEGYHLPSVHPALNRVLDYRSYTTATARWHSLQSSPLDAAAGPYGEGRALYWYLYPNTMLNVLPGRLQTNVVRPLGPGRCEVVFDYYYPAGTPPQAIAADHAFADSVQREDDAICAQVQRGLASGSYEPGPLHPQREAGLHHFHELLRAAWRAVLPLNGARRAPQRRGAAGTAPG